MNKKVAIIGFFAFNTEYNGGQENKTRALGELIKKKYGEENVVYVDTLNWKKNPFKILIKTILSIKKSDYVFMLPAHNGVKVFSALLLLFKRRKTKLLYFVIGGWLPNVIESDYWLSKKLKKFDAILVETKSMKRILEIQNFKNIYVFPNFKSIKPLKKFETNYQLPLKVCTFSRILKEKGIEDAISVVKKINEKYNDIVFELDLYGRVDPKYEAEFQSILEKSPKYITYKGVVPYNNTVNTIKNYFLLLFPTHFITEGVPGTIIDAYAAAVPVLSAKWNNFYDVIIDGKTGVGYEFDNLKDFEDKLEKLFLNQTYVINMKKNCLEEFVKYSEDYVSQLLDTII